MKRKKSIRKSKIRKKSRKSKKLKSINLKSIRKSRKAKSKLYDGGGSWENILKKHMKEKGFKLVRKSKHCVWENEEGNKIITSCTPKPSQYENILREIDRDIKKLGK